MGRENGEEKEKRNISSRLLHPRMMKVLVTVVVVVVVTAVSTVVTVATHAQFDYLMITSSKFSLAQKS